jgi:rubrerythrin
MSKEILEKALELEYEGIEVYQTLLERVKNEDVKKVLSQIAEAERSHIRFLEGKLGRAGGGEARRKSFAYAGKAGALITLDEGDKQGLRYAMNLERKNIDFYKSAAGKVDKSFSDFLKEILDQEKAHLESLQELNKKYQERRGS